MATGNGQQPDLCTQLPGDTRDVHTLARRHLADAFGTVDLAEVKRLKLQRPLPSR
jgi:hypothetical protein